ncbi:MAG TPA: hypothetical protein VGA45_01300 [Actinomycetota bacterium]
MGTGYLVYELLAAHAGALLLATVAVGLAALLVGWRWPVRPARASAGALVSGACPTERLAWPAAPSRQADPDAPGGPRPRAPDGARSTTA